MEPTISARQRTLNCKGKLIHLHTPKVMGIVNITPDSFYDGGKYNSLDKLEILLQQMHDDGADFVDIGACSSRPGADLVSSTEELNRLKPVLAFVLKKFPDLVVSLDTFRSEIASIAVKDYGVAIINDISAGDLDGNMFETIARLQVPYIMMHMQGTPQTMQQNPVYAHIVNDIIRYFSSKTEQLRQLGVHDVVLDPGFGFGKTLEQNYKLLQQLKDFSIFGKPLLVGLSRKSMIFKYLNCTPDEALNGTTVLHTLAILNSANILRVHDVKEARQTIELVQKCLAQE
jgi:dihydropteroate synthase